MKRVSVVLVLGAILLALTAGVALAATHYGTPGPDDLVGTRGTTSSSATAAMTASAGAAGMIS